MGLLSKYKIRGSAGFSHHVLLPLVAVLLVAGIGGYVMLKSSSAAACSTTTIARNSSNKTCVKSAQTYLKQRGYYKLSIDGKFGNGTYNAARNFQAAKGLCVDGIIGPQTWTSLIKNTKGTCGKKTTPIKPTTNSGSTSSPSTPTCSSGEILTTLTTGSQVCVKSSASSSGGTPICGSSYFWSTSQKKCMKVNNAIDCVAAGGSWKTTSPHCVPR